MKLNSFDKVKQLTEEMVAIPSINKEPGGESAVARYIQDFYMSLPYFQAHPEQVKCFQTKNDFVVRHSTLAYVKGTKGNSNRTVILIGHIDTVGVDDFGTIREYAFRCEELPAKLRETFVLPQEVIDDIESGEYLFGRGALDMKSGVAGHMYLIQYFSEHPEELDGNLLAIGECDEEDNSKGIITALDLLEELKEKEHFEYVACINADYSTNYAPGDENRYIYYGSIGKLLPCFAVFGKEAHVGQAFSALDPNLVLANITRKMSLNTDLCDIAQGEVAIPPISLKQMDTKGPYTVQTALTAFGYYNFFTHGWSPSIVLEKSKQMAVEAFDETVEYLNAQYKRFCELSKVDFHQLPWKTRVYTWNEFYNELAAVHGEAFKKAIHEFTVKLHEDDPELDLRLFGLRVVQEAWKWSEDKSPAVVVFFGSIFSARIEMTGRAAVGGFAGATVMAAIRWGAARGVYSNEAGVGSTIAGHCTADTDHPIRQAQFGIFEVFMDTIVICTITALAVLASGVWTQEGLSSGQLALAAFQSVFGNFGAIFVAITVFMFVFSTIISAGFFGQIQAEILFGRKFSKIWVFMYPLFIGIACAFSNVTTMYMITDGFMAIIVILNMIGLLLMCKQVKDLQKEYYNTPGMYYLADKAAKEAKKAAK